MIIDFHTHIFPPAIIQGRAAHLAQDSTLAALFADPRAPMATAEELIAAMDEAGVDMAVTLGIGWTNPELARRANDYLLESAARYPRRLAPFCSVNPSWGDQALREVERCARLGARGVGELHPDTQGFDLSSQEVMGPFMDAERSLKLILLTHSSEPVGHQYPGKGSITPPALMKFVERYQDVPIVCAHWGGGLPFYNLMPEVHTALKNVYFDTAASPFLYRASIFSTVPRLARPGSILFGSDYPLVKPGRIIRQIRAASISEEEKEAILGGNAMKLLGIVEDAEGNG
ncbi:MAG: amidohydrolase family protein [Dehalococcoidia bacterium]|nr:amidohydrolase family protein [Dehalococcoidia bacterium]